VEIGNERFGSRGRDIDAPSLRLVLDPEHEQRVAEHQLARLVASAHVRQVELSHLPRCQQAGLDRLDQPQAVHFVGARHRQQVLHRRVGHDRALAHALLDLLRQLPEQPQPP
jgi:hypothetical protein